MDLMDARLAFASSPRDLCKELGVTRQTLYRFVDPKAELGADAMKLLERKAQNVSS
jgi:hypothetical protein